MSVVPDGLATVSGTAGAPFDFSSWMLREQKRIFLLCQRMLRDPEEADSATQDVFLKAYRALQKREAEFDDANRWVTRIAVNTCLDRLRSQRWQFWRRRPGVKDETVILQMEPSRTPNAEERVFASEISARLARALYRLSDRQRAVFVLRHHEDRSLDEIATILGLDTGTVKAHMARAIAKLREELRDFYQPRKRVES